MMDELTKRRALQYVTAMKVRWNNYLSEVEEFHRSGEGRTKGYTFPYCFHGKSRWTDYDNICAGCEDGFNGYNPLEFYRWAVGRAKADRAKMKERADWLAQAPRDLWTDSPGLDRKILDWVMEPMKQEAS